MPVLRMSATVRFCFAFCRASRKFGISRAAMMPMIATTISSSISVKPFCRFFSLLHRAQHFLDLLWLREYV